MTGLEKILNEIRKESEENVSLIISEAEKTAAEIIETAREEAQAEAEEILKSAEKSEKDIISRAVSYGELELRKALLLKKHSIIKDVMNDAKAKLINLPDEEYFEFLTKLLKKYAHSEAGVIMLSKKDKERITTSFSDELSQNNLSVSEKNLKEEGGFILIYGDIEEKCTISALFESEEERLSDIVMEAVFD